MSRTVFLIALTLVGLLGFAIRLAPLDDRHLSEGSRALGETRWVVDDAGTALHLRRIELALAEGRVPQHDPFLAHGEVAEIPALPVFDALIAGFAERWIAHAGGDPSLGGVDEADLENFAAWVGPVAYVLAFLALAWAAWTSTRGRAVPTVLAVTLFALAPAAVTATEVGRLDTVAFVLVLFALLVRGTQIAVTAEDALSTILEALLCGVIAGLLTSLTALGALLALPTGAALLFRALRGPIEVRPIAVRAGLLFCLAAAFIARLPLADGPWEQLPEGLVARWALASSDVLLMSAAPFALLLLTAPRDPTRQSRSFARIVAMAAMLALLVFELPRAWSAASGPVTAWWTARAVLGSELDGSSALAVLIFATPLAAVGVVYACVRLRVARDASSLHLALLAIVTAVLAWVEPDAASLFAVASACALAAAVAELHADRAQLTWLGAGSALLVLLGFAKHELNVVASNPWERDGVLEAIASLRWIRTGVPAGGPFNSSTARSTWGILADPEIGELVAYHARRPVFASNSAAFTHPELVLEARALADGIDGAELVARMHAHGLQVAIAAPNLAHGPGIVGSAGEWSTRSGLNPLPNSTRLLPREVPDDSGSPGLLYSLTVVWSLNDLPPPREPSLVAPR